MRKFLFFLTAILLLTACKSKPAPVVIEEEPVIIVKEPEFEILSIAIIKADLVNTQFEAVLRIENPNGFPVDLSSLSYVLYGNGKFWADGKGADILHIPAQSFCETEFYFSMNFINMNRNLLDDIIALRQVRYRFSGDVEVIADFPRVSPFRMNFERSGLSNVKEKARKKPPSEKVYTGALHAAVDNW